MKTGRNDPCPCGSKKKFKNCCESKTDSRRQSRVLMLIVGAALVSGIAAAIVSFTGDSTGGGGRVWDPAHGHYHDVNGVAVP